jgi:methylglutaconyl-CoA hydratase
MDNLVLVTEITVSGVATITFNRPDFNNAYNEDFLDQFSDCMEKMDRDNHVRLILIRGAGRHFQAGADIQWLKDVSLSGFDENYRISKKTAETFWQLHNLKTVTIALVQGACMGGGCGIVASCDIVLAERTSLFAVSEARLGMVANIIFPQLIEAVGMRHTRRYALTGEIFSAGVALEIGLVSEIVDPGDIDQRAKKMIDELLSAGPGTATVSKRGFLAFFDKNIDRKILDELILGHAEKRMSGEALEGINSFLAKRKPSWEND